MGRSDARADESGFLPELDDMLVVEPGGFFSFRVGDVPTWCARFWWWIDDSDVYLSLARTD